MFLSFRRIFGRVEHRRLGLERTERFFASLRMTIHSSSFFGLEKTEELSKTDSSGLIRQNDENKNKPAIS